MLEKYLDEKNNLSPDSRDILLRKLINLGILQVIYKNCKEEQK